MNARRLRMLAESQTGIAKKVLNACPLADYWTVRQIASEMHRLGTATDLNIIGGCLTTLLSAGLIKLQNGAYQRVAIPTEDPADAAPSLPPGTTLEVPHV